MFFERSMLHMARQDNPEDGWSLMVTLEPEMLEVFEREVSWSEVAQWKAHVPKIGCTLKHAFDKLTERTKAQAEEASKTTKTLHVAQRPGNELVGIEYRHIALPWPLQDRDLVYAYAFVLNEERGNFIGYFHNVGLDNIAQRLGCIRGSIMFQGYVATAVEG